MLGRRVALGDLPCLPFALKYSFRIQPLKNPSLFLENGVEKKACAAAAALRTL